MMYPLATIEMTARFTLAVVKTLLEQKVDHDAILAAIETMEHIEEEARMRRQEDEKVIMLSGFNSLWRENG